MSTPSSNLRGPADAAGPLTDLVAVVRAQVQAELATQRRVVSGASYTSALRAASARASVHVDGVGDVPTAAGTTVPVDDLSPQLRMARRHQHGRRLAPELELPRVPGMVSGPAARSAIRVQQARVLEQEQHRDQERGRQVQAHQLQALRLAGAFEVQQHEDRRVQHQREMQAEAGAWAASVANSQAEGTRRAAADLQAAMQAHTSS